MWLPLWNRLGNRTMLLVNSVWLERDSIYSMLLGLSVEFRLIIFVFTP